MIKEEREIQYLSYIDQCNNFGNERRPIQTITFSIYFKV